MYTCVAYGFAMVSCSISAIAIALRSCGDTSDFFCGVLTTNLQGTTNHGGWEVGGGISTISAPNLSLDCKSTLRNASESLSLFE